MNWTRARIPGKLAAYGFVIGCAALAAWQWEWIDMASAYTFSKISPKHTVKERLTQYGAAVRTRLEPCFRAAGVEWPARRMIWIGLKQERQLEIWAEDRSGRMRYVRTYPILGASGTGGPKLREGDGQVPEGLYGIESLNPNSAYHLSLRVNYPNAFDRERAKEDGREQLGGDIMIHGKAVSAGCLAMGDEAAEDLFVIAALAGPAHVEVVLSPCDLRVKNGPPPGNALHWVPQLYQTLKAKLQTLRREPNDRAASPKPPHG
jgi:hypothetical protein